ncbi:MAG: hypothetical protein GF411_15550 [Candidatus Lokiarchaeota archaeon]|nr:hypothetical protein [Candidatus Lokiarchaeota archaeon]
MSIQEKFEEEMAEICEKYYELDKERDAIEEQLEQLKDYIEITLRKYGKDEYDDPKNPVRVKKITYTSERMKRGGKDKLREILTEEEWSEVYGEPKEVESVRVSTRRNWDE